jgi:probable HAF family extracellular repeat protein
MITTEGETKSMKSRISVSAITTLFALAPLAVAQKAAAPIDLGTLGGSASLATGVGSTNDEVVGGANVFTDAYQHAVYTNSLGYLEDLESLIGVYGNSVASGIGAKGAITGTSDQIIDAEGDIASHAFYFTSSRTGLVDLGTNGGTLAQGNGTQNGIVVGASTVAGDVAYTGFFWTAKKGMVNLNTLAHDEGLNGYNSFAFAINTADIAVGNSDATDGNTHAVAWNLKTKGITDLGYLGAPYQGAYAQANAINDGGTLVGFSTLADGQTDAFVGTISGGLTDIGNLGGSYAQANGVNDNGVVVGSSNIAGDTDVHAFIWTQSGGMVDLNTLPGLSGSAFIELNSANAIAVDGTIVGVGLALDGQYHAFTW